MKKTSFMKSNKHAIYVKESFVRMKMMKTKDIEKNLKTTVITQENLGELLKALAILDIKFQIIFQ